MRTLTLKGLNKRNTQAIYIGARTAIRVNTVNFTDKIPPQRLEVDDDVLGPKPAKVKLTKEERAALPKPTAAERIARMEKRLAAAKAKMSDAVRM